MADSAPAAAAGPQSVTAHHRSAMRRARGLPASAPAPHARDLVSSRCRALPASIFVLSVFLLLTPSSCQSQNLYGVCKSTDLEDVCYAWPLKSQNTLIDFGEKFTHCELAVGLYKHSLQGTHIVVRLLNESKTVLCKIGGEETEKVRMRRQTGYKLRGRYRGQTQSQYLSIERGNGKDDGKAEAHSAADSSRAIVTGNSGMGQAQSQTVYDPSCEDCNGRHDQDGTNSMRGPSGSNSGHGPYGPDQNINYADRNVPATNRISNYPQDRFSSHQQPSGTFNNMGSYPVQQPGMGTSKETSPPQNIVSLPGVTGIYPNGNSASTNQQYPRNGNDKWTNSFQGGNSELPNGNGQPSNSIYSRPSMGPTTSGLPSHHDGLMSSPRGVIPGQGTIVPVQGGIANQGSILPSMQGVNLQGKGGGLPVNSVGQTGQGGNILGPGGNLPNQGGNIPRQVGLMPGQSGPITSLNGLIPGQGRIEPVQAGFMPGHVGLTNQAGNLPIQGGGLLGNGDSLQGGMLPGHGGILPSQGGTPQSQAGLLPHLGGPLSGRNDITPGQGGILIDQGGKTIHRGNIPSQGGSQTSQEPMPQILGRSPTNQGGIPLSQGGLTNYPLSNGNTNIPGISNQGNLGWPILSDLLREKGVVCCFVPDTQNSMGSGSIFNRPPYSGGTTGQRGSGVPGVLNNGASYSPGTHTQSSYPGASSTYPGIGGPNAGASYFPYGQSKVGVPGQPGQNAYQSHNGQYPGSGQNNLQYPGVDQTNTQTPTGPYTQQHSTGPNNLQTSPGQHTGIDQSNIQPSTGTGQTNVQYPSGYPNTGQNNLQTSNGQSPGAGPSNVQYPPGYTSTGQNNLQSPSVYNPGNQNNLQPGQYPGSGQSSVNQYPGTGQNNVQSPPGIYAGTSQSYPGTSHTNAQYPGSGQNNAQYPGSGQNNAQYPGSGQNNGQYPGLSQGNGQYPNSAQNTGQYPGSGQNTGQYPESGPSNGQYPGSGQNTGQYPGSSLNTGHYPGSGQYPESGQNTGQYPGSGQNTGQYPGSGQNTVHYPGSDQNTGQYPGSGQNTDQYPGFGQNNVQYPGSGQNNGQYPGTGQNNGQYPGLGQNNGQYPGTGQNNGRYPGAGQNNAPYPGLGQNNGQYPGTGQINGPYPGSGQTNVQYPGSGQNNAQYPGTGQNNYQPGVNRQQGNGIQQGFDSQGNPIYNTEYTGEPQNVLDPNSILSTLDDYDSEAQASVSQAVNGTTALATSKGGNEKGRAQTQVEGTYTGTGSFSANAEISDDNKAAQSHVSGSKKGAAGSAEGRGRKNKSQASVKLGSETGSILTDSQSSGDMHSSSSQVQGSVKGGMADAQAKGPGSTSSQAQIGFTPYKDTDKEKHDLLKAPFEGGGTASAQSSRRMGTSQSQLRGTFKYGINYNGAAQAGSSVDKDAVFSNLLPFDKIDVFDENNKNINVDVSTTEKPDDATISLTENYDENITEKNLDTLSDNTDNELAGHVHSDHHTNNESKMTIQPPSVDNTPVTTVPSAVPPTGSPPAGTRRSFDNNNYGSTTTNGGDYEYPTDKEIADEYDIDDGFGSEGADNTPVEQGEYTNYDDITRDTETTHQSLQTNPNKKSYEIKQTTGGNTQHIILGSLNNHDAKIIQKNSEHPDVKRVYQPGERVPGMGGYTIPAGFTGSVKSVASKENTYVVGSKYSPSQAQTVKLTPGTGKVQYVYPNNYGQNINRKDLRSLRNSKPDDNRYVSVSKSVTRDLDSENNIRKQYSHTYYTKSSSCGYFTFTCTMVSSAEGKKKVCKPKIPTNPDGTRMRC